MMQTYEAYHANDISIGTYTDISNRTHIVRHYVLENDDTSDQKEKLFERLADIFTHTQRRMKA